MGEFCVMVFLKKFFVCLLCILILTACTGQTGNKESSGDYPVLEEKTLDERQDDSIQDFGYPIEENNSDNVNLPDTIVIPDPSSESAVVYGRLLSISQNNSPYIAPSLFLGQIISSENGDEKEDEIFLGSISIEDDPQAKQAKNGTFVFTEVPPGSYGLFIWTPVSAFIVEDEDTGKPIILDVQSAEIYDLGNIFVP
jgi:hypothetical protein